MSLNLGFRHSSMNTSCSCKFIQDGPQKSSPVFRFARVLVIFSLASVCILRRVFEQLVNSRAVTMLKYTRCNIVILMAATPLLMSSYQFLCRVRI